MYNRDDVSFVEGKIDVTRWKMYEEDTRFEQDDFVETTRGSLSCASDGAIGDIAELDQFEVTGFDTCTSSVLRRASVLCSWN